MSKKLKSVSIAMIFVAIVILSFLMLERIGILSSSFATVSFPSIQTSLEWYSSDYPTKIDWYGASSYCVGLSNNLGKYPYVSWRLPTIDELKSVYATTSSSSPVFKDWFYWSSTEFSTTSDLSVYDLDMTKNILSTPTIFYKNLPDDYVRCVRGITIVPPDAPTNVSASAGNTQAKVSFSPPISNGGSVVTSYTVTSNPDGITATGLSSPIMVNGLTNGTNYTFTVTANNVAGTSKVSMSSNAVMPRVFVYKRVNPVLANVYCSGIADYYGAIDTSNFSGGSGTQSDPYQISSWAGLNSIRNALCSYYILTTNLSSTTSGYSGIGNNWSPIGTDEYHDFFAGNFDGNGHTISDLTGSSNGLFSHSAGYISNVGLLNINITGGADVGGLVGYLMGNGTIINSYSTGNIVAGYDVGGLVGLLGDAEISKSYSKVNVTGSDDSIGGIIGRMTDGLVNDSYATGNVSGSTYLGGIAGLQEGGEIHNSYSIGNINGVSYCDDYCQDVVFNSYWNTDISGGGSYGSGGIGMTTTQMKNILSYAGNTNVSAPTNNGSHDDLGSEVFTYFGADIYAYKNSPSGIRVYSSPLHLSGSRGGLYNEDFIWNSVAGASGYLVTIQSSDAYSSDGSFNKDVGTNLTAELPNDYYPSGWTEGTFAPSITSPYNPNWNMTTSLTDLNNGYPYLSWQVGGGSSTWLIY